MKKQTARAMGWMLTGLLVSLGWPLHAQAATIGGQLFSTGGDVTVEVLPASAGFTSELHLFSPGPDRFIATNRDVGTIVDLGSFPIGEELLFGIFVRNTGITYFMGPGSRNPDGIPHAGVEVLGAGHAIVGFEDLFGGGDRDYDDNVFRFRGGIVDEPPPSGGPAIPEPGSAALIGLGLLGGTLRRRKRS